MNPRVFKRFTAAFLAVFLGLESATASGPWTLPRETTYPAARLPHASQALIARLTLALFPGHRLPVAPQPSLLHRLGQTMNSGSPKTMTPRSLWRAQWASALPVSLAVIEAAIHTLWASESSSVLTASFGGFAFFYWRYSVGRALQLQSRVLPKARLKSLIALAPTMKDPQQKRATLRRAVELIPEVEIFKDDLEHIFQLVEQLFATQDDDLAEKILHKLIVDDAGELTTYHDTLRWATLVSQIPDSEKITLLWKIAVAEFSPNADPESLPRAMALSQALYVAGQRERARDLIEAGLLQVIPAGRLASLAFAAKVSAIAGDSQAALTYFRVVETDFSRSKRKSLAHAVELEIALLMAVASYHLGERKKAKGWLRRGISIILSNDLIYSVPEIEQALSALIDLPEAQTALKNLLIQVKRARRFTFPGVGSVYLPLIELISRIPDRNKAYKVIDLVERAPGFFEPKSMITASLAGMFAAENPEAALRRYHSITDESAGFSIPYLVDERSLRFESSIRALSPLVDHRPDVNLMAHAPQEPIDAYEALHLYTLSAQHLAAVDVDRGTLSKGVDSLLQSPLTHRNQQDIVIAIVGRMLQDSPQLVEGAEAWDMALDGLERLSEAQSPNLRWIHELEQTLTDVLIQPNPPIEEHHLRARFVQCWEILAGRPFPSENPEKTARRLTIKDQLAHLLLAFEWRIVGWPTDMLDTLLTERPKGLGLVRPFLGLSQSSDAVLYESVIQKWTDHARRLPPIEREKFFRSMVDTLRQSVLVTDAIREFNLRESLAGILLDMNAFAQKPLLIQKLIVGQIDLILGTDFRHQKEFNPHLFEHSPRLFRAVFHYQAKHKGPLLQQVLAAYIGTWLRTANAARATKTAYRVLRSHPGNALFLDRIWLQGLPARAYEVRVSENTATLLREMRRGQWQEALRVAHQLADVLEDPTPLRQALDPLQSETDYTPEAGKALEKALRALPPFVPGTPNFIRKQESLQHLHHARSHHGDLAVQSSQTVWIRVLYDPIDILEMRFPQLGGSCLDCEVGSNAAFTQHYVTHLGFRNLSAFTRVEDPRTGEITERQIASVTVARNARRDIQVISRIHNNSPALLDAAFADYIQRWAQQMRVKASIPEHMKDAGTGQEFSLEALREFGQRVPRFQFTVPQGPLEQTEFYSDSFGMTPLPITLSPREVWQFNGRSSRLKQLHKVLPMLILPLLIALAVWAVGSPSGPSAAAAGAPWLLHRLHRKLHFPPVRPPSEHAPTAAWFPFVHAYRDRLSELRAPYIYLIREIVLKSRSQSELADELKVYPSTVNTQIYRALEAFKALIQTGEVSDLYLVREFEKLGGLDLLPWPQGPILRLYFLKGMREKAIAKKLSLSRHRVSDFKAMGLDTLREWWNTEIPPDSAVVLGHPKLVAQLPPRQKTALNYIYSKHKHHRATILAQRWHVTDGAISYLRRTGVKTLRKQLGLALVLLSIGLWVSASADSASPGMIAIFVFPQAVIRLGQMSKELRNLRRQKMKARGRIYQSEKRIRENNPGPRTPLEQHQHRLPALREGYDHIRREIAALRVKIKQFKRENKEQLIFPMPQQEDSVIDTLRRANEETLMSWLEAAWKGQNRPYKPKIRQIQRLVNAAPPVHLARLRDVDGIKWTYRKALVDYVRAQISNNGLEVLLLPLLLPLILLSWIHDSPTSTTAFVAPFFLHRAA